MVCAFSNTTGLAGREGTTDLETREVTPFDLAANATEAFLDIWVQNLTRSWILELQAQTAANQCNSTVTPEDNEMHYEIRTSAINDTDNLLSELFRQAFVAWVQSSSKDPYNNGLLRPWDLITNLEIKEIGCAFSPVCHINTSNESYQLFCAFSNSRGLSRRDSTTDLAKREITGFDLAGNASYIFSILRNIASQELPSKLQILARSWPLELEAQKDATSCRSIVPDPDTEIYYEILTSTINNKETMLQDMFFRAVTAWTRSEIEDPHNAISSSYQRPWDLITNATFKSFGCAWSPICNIHTEQESYELYCAFSNETSLFKRDGHGSEGTEAPTRYIGPYDLNKAAQIFFTELRNDLAHINLAQDAVTIQVSPEAKAQAGLLAQACSDKAAICINEIIFAANPDSVVTKNATILYLSMTNDAFAAWKAEMEDMSNQGEYFKIVNASIDAFGCAWSEKCRPPPNGEETYYLHCVFAGDMTATASPKTTVSGELRVRKVSAW